MVKAMTDPINNTDVAGYVITRQIDHKKSAYITCDYVTEEVAQEKYREISALLRFPEELTCRKAWLKEHKGKRYYTERE